MRQVSLLVMILIASFAVYQSFSLRSAAPIGDGKIKEVPEPQKRPAVGKQERDFPANHISQANQAPPREQALQQLGNTDDGQDSQPDDASIGFRQVTYFDRDTSGIDYKFIEGGTPFDVDLTKLKSLEKGDQVAFDLGPIHFVLNGEVTEVIHTANDQIAVHVKFIEDGNESSVYLHFDAQGNLEAKMYTSAGSFELVHNGHVGFIISFEEMENLERLELEQ